MKTIKNTKLTPKQLFIIDGLGAILSAFLLGVVIVKFERYFGIPISTLYFLGALPILFALFDLYAFLNKNDRSALHLKIISIFNILYCGLSLSLAFYHSNSLTLLGWAYIILEIIIVTALAQIEYITSKQADFIT